MRVRTNGEVRDVTLGVAPLDGGKTQQRHYLILFEVRPPSELAAEGKLGIEPSKPSKKSTAAEQQIAALKEDWLQTRDELHHIIEEQEATNEELQSRERGDSLQQQSCKARMKSSRRQEELQATNEELTTVNEELHTRNAELAKANNDLNNLLTSIDIVYLMLDRELRIQRFTPGAQKALNLIPGDVGRPVSDINLKIDVPNLAEKVEEVVDSFTPLETEVRDSSGRWYSMRVRPYKTEDNRIDGAILAFVDIDEAKRGREALSESAKGWRELVEEAPDFILAACIGRALVFEPHGRESCTASRAWREHP
ncbi:MAG: PAS domain-containing protein [Bryobacterales bacterium]